MGPWIDCPKVAHHPGLGCWLAACVLALAGGCERPADSRGQPPPDTEPAELLPSQRVKAWHAVEELPGPIAQFETVFWEPADTLSLREQIWHTPLVRDRSVLEIGTGTGLVALCCLGAGASRVVATDINPAAVSNARYNARLLGWNSRLDVRLVPLASPGAFTVIEDQERFDLIVSNPPWEPGTPTHIAEFALYDQEFVLLESLLRGLPRYLRPGGRALLAYGCVTAIRRASELAEQLQLRIEFLDDRRLEDLPEVFLPGMLLEVTVPDRHPSGR